MTKYIIWSNDFDATREENWQEAFEEYCEENELNIDEQDINDYINETLSIYLQDERMNLDVDVDGVIVVFADLGLWNGHHNGGGIVGNNVSDILNSNNCDYVSWFCDRHNVRCDASHHDGTNHYLYRVAKDKYEAEKLVNLIAYGGMTEEEFRKRTKSLRPYVAKVHGW